MEKKMKLNTSFKEASKTKKFVRVNFQDDQIAEWLLNLSLLSYNLISTISIVTDEEFKLKIKKDVKVNAKIANRRGRVSKGDNGIELAVSQDELDSWLLFFLQYYRDGVGDVDHMDVEIITDSRYSEPNYFYLTFMVPKMKPLMSPKELSQVVRHLKHRSK